MKTKLKSFLLASMGLFAASLASAQTTLETFSAFESGNTYFLGNWELNGDAGGTNSPRPSFSQGAGFYNFAGGSNSDTASAFSFFNTAVDITGYSLLEVSAKLLAGNTAPTFTISLFDSLGESAMATFATASFSTAGFTTFSTALVFSPGFDVKDLSSFSISGNVIGGSDVLSFSLDNLAVSAPRALTAVPEASTFALFGGLALFVLIGARGFRRRRGGA